MISVEIKVHLNTANAGEWDLLPLEEQRTALYKGVDGAVMKILAEWRGKKDNMTIRKSGTREEVSVAQDGESVVKIEPVQASKEEEPNDKE